MRSCWSWHLLLAERWPLALSFRSCSSRCLTTSRPLLSSRPATEPPPPICSRSSTLPMASFSSFTRASLGNSSRQLKKKSPTSLYIWHQDGKPPTLLVAAGFLVVQLYWFHERRQCWAQLSELWLPSAGRRGQAYPHRVGVTGSVSYKHKQVSKSWVVYTKYWKVKMCRSPTK